MDIRLKISESLKQKPQKAFLYRDTFIAKWSNP